MDVCKCGKFSNFYSSEKFVCSECRVKEATERRNKNKEKRGIELRGQDSLAKWLSDKGK